MAKRFELGIRGIAAAAGAAYATVHTGSAQRARIREIGFFVSAATLTPVGLGRPANTPVATTSVLGLVVDPADPTASTINIDTAWSTAPTAPTNFLRRAQVPATAGAGLIWSWPADQPLVIPASAWLVFWNFSASAGAAPDIYVVYEE